MVDISTRITVNRFSCTFLESTSTLKLGVVPNFVRGDNSKVEKLSGHQGYSRCFWIRGTQICHDFNSQKY